MSSPDVVVRLAGAGECEAVHVRTGARLRTSMSPAYGGRGNSYSSTDLLAAALATCIASSIEPVALRHDIGPERIEVSAAKTLASSPRRVTALAVLVQIDGAVAGDVLVRLRRAADSCAVHRSLHPDVAVSIEVRQTAAGS